MGKKRKQRREGNSTATPSAARSGHAGALPAAPAPVSPQTTSPSSPHASPAASAHPAAWGASVAAPAAAPADSARTRRRTWRIVGLSAVGLGILALGYHLRSIINPLLLSLFLAYMLTPIVDFFERKGIPRAACITGLYAILLTAITLVVVLAVPAAFAQGESLIGVIFRGDRFEDLNQNKSWDEGEPIQTDYNGNGKADPSVIDRAIARAGDFVRSWNERYPERKIDSEVVYTQVRDWAKKHAGEITETGVGVGGSVARGVKTGLSGFFDLASYLILVPVYIFFFLLGINHLRDAVFAHLPGQYREDIVRILYKIHAALSSFFRGKVLVCLTKGLITFVGLWLVGVKFSLVFGALQAIGSLVPFVVMIIGFLPAEIVVIMDQGWSWWPILATAGVFLLAEAAETVLTPMVLGKEVGLHPLTLIVALMIGGELFGFFGVLMSVPLASIAKIMFDEFVEPPLRALAAETPEPADADG